MNCNQTYYALCFKALVASVYLLPVPASFSFVPLPLFIMFWQVRLFMQRDPTKIQECHLCLLIQDRATLPFLLATSRQNTNALTAPQLSPVTKWQRPNCFACREGIRVQPTGHLPSPLRINSPPKPHAFQSYNSLGFSQHKHVTARGTVIVFAHAIGLNMALFDP